MCCGQGIFRSAGAKRFFWGSCFYKYFSPPGLTTDHCYDPQA